MASREIRAKPLTRPSYLIPAARRCTQKSYRWRVWISPRFDQVFRLMGKARRFTRSYNREGSQGALNLPLRAALPTQQLKISDSRSWPRRICRMTSALGRRDKPSRRRCERLQPTFRCDNSFDGATPTAYAIIEICSQPSTSVSSAVRDTRRCTVRMALSTRALVLL